MIYQGETIRLLAQNIKDLNGIAITSPSSIVILVTKPDSTQASISSGWVNDGSGNYHYDYQILSTDPAGKWAHMWTITNGNYVSIEESTFTVNSSRIQ